MRIALDIMGGDHAPAELMAGAWQYGREHPDSELLLVGREEIISACMEQYRFNRDQVTVVHAMDTIAMDEAPAAAIRKKPQSSIAIASKLVREGKADALVSCGNTGAQLAAAIFIIGRIEGVERPPIAGTIPNMAGGHTLLIDIGANVDCTPRQLLQFALLGQVYAAAFLNIERPRVALLNNGEEESKGNALTLETYQLMCRQPQLNFTGNIEGRDLFADHCDVIVCDGFTGNVLLKSLEGMAIYLGRTMQQQGMDPRSILERLDYTRVGGAPLLGINGISIVGHGSSRRDAVASALKIAADCVKNGMVDRQIAALNELNKETNI